MPRIGVDAGSTTFKAVLVDGAGVALASLCEEAEPVVGPQVERALTTLGPRARGAPVAATGYGRRRVAAATRTLTEIRAHALGAWAKTRRAGVLLEVGGQDSKVIHIGARGAVLDFRMNDKCAAGTGRFLEGALARLRVDYGDLDELLRTAPRTARVSSTCAVFAETEVVSLLAEGVAVNAIVRALHAALVETLLGLVGTIPAGLPLYMAGGVALNAGLAAMFGERVGQPVDVLPDPQLNGALGAALALDEPSRSGVSGEG